MENSDDKGILEMIKEIEIYLVDAQKDLSIMGRLQIKMQSFEAKINSMNGSVSPNILGKLKEFKYKMKILNEKKKKEKLMVEKEMEESQITSRTISETGSRGDVLNEDDEFYSVQTGKLNEFIMTTMDTINDLKTQNKYINSINMKLNNGYRRMGLSQEMIKHIEKKLGAEKILFIGGCLLIFFIVYLLK